MQTLESLLKKGTTILKDNGLEEAGLDAWLLLEFKTGKNQMCIRDRDTANEGCGEDQKNRGIPADHVACIQKSPGNPVHFHSHLVKYLLKYRQDFYQKDQDHNSHHAKHEQRVSDCRPYLS